jgi:hypothetical protein
MFHCCGNPFHDIPMNLAAALPILAPALFWLRSRFGRKPTHKPHTECGGKH